MKPSFTGAVLIALFISSISYAQNNTPIETLISIAHEDTRFIPIQLFTSDDRDASYLDSYLSAYTTLKIDQEELLELVRSDQEAIAMRLPFHQDKSLSVKMVNHDIRSNDFAIIDLESGQNLPIPVASFYRGILEQSRESVVGMSFFEDEVYGIISNEEGNIVLIPDPFVEGEEGLYILYKESDILFDRKGSCDNDLLHTKDLYQESVSREKVYETCKDVEVYIEATYELQQAKGGSSATANYITAFFNNASIIYRNEGIYTSLKRIAVNNPASKYAGLNTSFEKLNKFGELTKNNYQQHGAELAHLVDYNEEGLGGVAWIGALCQNYYYSSAQDYHVGAYAYSSVHTSQANFPDYSLTVFMFTHEMGHNLGSQHTQWCGWDGGALDNCAPAEKGNCSPGPAPTNGGTIMSYCHEVNEIGVNFNHGFGTQPGNLIRNKVAEKTCIEEYTPSRVVMTSPNLTIHANRECTDKDGWTHYYSDQATADEADDILVLSVLKGSEDIGNLDDGSLQVRMLTSSNAGTGSTKIENPGYQIGDDWHVMNRWFELIPTNEPSQPVSVRFPYTNDDLMDVMMNQPSVGAHTDLIFYKINAPGDPDPDSGHSSVSNDDITFYMNGNDATLNTWKYVKRGSNHLAEFKVSSFSGGGGGFSENTQGALPVELVEFTARPNAEMVQLLWQTANEINNEFFTIERSRDGVHFEIIGKVNGQGSTEIKSEYGFLDREPFEGRNYYRLSQTDFDGRHEYLGTRSVMMSEKREIRIFPNPVITDHLTIEYNSSLNQSVTTTVSSIDGKLVSEQKLDLKKGSNTAVLNVSLLEKGIYLLRISGKKGSVTKKLIKD